MKNLGAILITLGLALGVCISAANGEEIEFDEVILGQLTLLDGTTHYDPYGISFEDTTYYVIDDRIPPAGADDYGITTTDGPDNEMTIVFTPPAISVTLDWATLGTEYISATAYDSDGIPLDTQDDTAPHGSFTFSGVGLIAKITLSDNEGQIAVGRLEYFNCYPDLPNPELTCNGWEDYVGSDGEDYTRYWLSVVNWPEFPDALFEAAPDLPACVLNTNASRTWVRIYDQDDNYIYGFCALPSSDWLTSIWYALPRGTPPECVYITLTDRRCEQVYTSNLVCPQWVDETGWAIGTRYVEKGNWGMYHEHDGEETVDLRADGGDGVGMVAGSVHFSAVDAGNVTITITLNEGWRFADVDENVKIQDYDSVPTAKNPKPGKFDNKDDATESPFVMVVPANNYYGVHVDLEWLDCVEE